MNDFSVVEAVMEEAVGRVFPAAQLVIRVHGETALSRMVGWLDPDKQRQPVRPDTLFDLASVTKLFTVSAFMTLADQGAVGLDQAVASVLPKFSGSRPIRPYEDPLVPGAFVSVAPEGGTEDAGRVTFRHLLSHNSGLPAWRPLWRQPTPEAARDLALSTHFAYPTGTRCVYSDVGLILLGMSLEQLTGQRLDEVIKARVTDPLGLVQTCYLPFEGPRASDMPHAAPPDNIAATELCGWRKRRVVGEVHDENAAALGGIAGHAGLFSTAAEVALFGQSFLQGRFSARDRLLSPSTVTEMTSLQAQDGDIRRGLGFALWSPDPEASGNAFSPEAFGHTGFTGTSLWIDPVRDLVVACNTNRVYYGRDASGILSFRVALHKAIVSALA